MNYKYLDALQDCVKREPPLYEEVVKKTMRGEVLMLINTNKARAVYFRITNSVFVKSFHMVLTIITNPITICVYLIYAVIQKYWLFGVPECVIIIGGLVVMENYIIRQIILSHSLKDSALYHQLYMKGIIGIKYIPE